MKSITQRELRNSSAAVMDAVEAGEAFCITRHGTAVAELRPAGHGSFVSSGDAKAAFSRLTAGDFASLRADADAVLGEDRLGG